MNKLIYKGSATFGIAEIPGKYLAADLEGSDLIGIVSSHPVLFWTTLIVFIVLCVGYGIYHLAKRKKTS